MEGAEPAGATVVTDSLGCPAEAIMGARGLCLPLRGQRFTARRIILSPRCGGGGKDTGGNFRFSAIRGKLGGHDGFPDSLPRLLRQGAPEGFPGCVHRRRQEPGRPADQEELPLVPRAPLAEDEVKAHADPLSKGKRAVHRLREEFRHVLAGKHQVPFPAVAPNQRVSRHRRKSALARWRITHRLVSETPRTLQISTVPSPSISRSVKALAWVGESSDRHILTRSRNSACR